MGLPSCLTSHFNLRAPPADRCSTEVLATGWAGLSESVHRWQRSLLLAAASSPQQWRCRCCAGDWRCTWKSKLPSTKLLPDRGETWAYGTRVSLICYDASPMLRLGSRNFIEVTVKRQTTGSRGKKRVRVAGGSEASTKSMLSHSLSSVAEERPSEAVQREPAYGGAGQEILTADLGIPARDTLGMYALHPGPSDLHIFVYCLADVACLCKCRGFPRQCKPHTGWDVGLGPPPGCRGGGSGKGVRRRDSGQNAAISGPLWLNHAQSPATWSDPGCFRSECVWGGTSLRPGRTDLHCLVFS